LTLLAALPLALLSLLALLPLLGLLTLLTLLSLLLVLGHLTAGRFPRVLKLLAGPL
jgi:hypothetical protein